MAKGEYYIDVDASLLHFCPPGGDATQGEAAISIGTTAVSMGAVALAGLGRLVGWGPLALSGWAMMLVWHGKCGPENEE